MFQQKQNEIFLEKWKWKPCDGRQAPLADSVMSWDHLIDKSAAGGWRRGCGIQHYRAKRHFLLSLSRSQLLPEPETRAVAQTDGHEVCLCVWMCGGWWRHSVQYKHETQEILWRGGKRRRGTRVTRVDIKLRTVSLLLVYSIMGTAKVHLRCHFAFACHTVRGRRLQVRQRSWWQYGTPTEDCGGEDHARGTFLYWQTAIYWNLQELQWTVH